MIFDGQLQVGIDVELVPGTEGHQLDIGVVEGALLLLVHLRGADTLYSWALDLEVLRPTSLQSGEG